MFSFHKYSDTKLNFCSFPLQRQASLFHSWSQSSQYRSAHHPTCQCFSANPYRASVHRTDPSFFKSLWKNRNKKKQRNNSSSNSKEGFKFSLCHQLDRWQDVFQRGFLERKVYSWARDAVYLRNTLEQLRQKKYLCLILQTCKSTLNHSGHKEMRTEAHNTSRNMCRAVNWLVIQSLSLALGCVK